MVETISYAPAKEGLTALDRFLARKSDYTDLPPFTLPVRYRFLKRGNSPEFRYYLSTNRTEYRKQFIFSLSEEEINRLGDAIYVIPHIEASRGLNPYYWLTLHLAPTADSVILTSCRLRPELDENKINFKAWHGLEEQLMADYVLGVNSLLFADLLPFNLMSRNRSSLLEYRIAGVNGLLIRIGNNSKISDNDTLRFVFKTDEQQLYEWVDILKVERALPEEKWPLISSYRILPREHRIYSNGWVGPERQSLIDHMRSRPEIEFKNLRPIRVPAINNGTLVNVIDVYSYSGGRRTQRLRGALSLHSNPIAPGEETISIPRQDDQGIYEWLELYRYDPSTNGPKGEVLASGRITPEGINQKNWLGVEKQLLKDYIAGIVSFNLLEPIIVKKGRDKNVLYLWAEGKNGKIHIVCLGILRRFNLKPGDELTLVPEKECEEGTDFLLVKDGITLARYRLDLKTKKFTCIDNLAVNENQEVDDLEEYEKALLGGQIMSYEEFMRRRQV